MQVEQESSRRSLQGPCTGLTPARRLAAARGGKDEDERQEAKVRAQALREPSERGLQGARAGLTPARRLAAARRL
jgi:hypothetical protein